MQKIILIIIGIAVVGGGAWYFTQDSPSQEIGNNTTEERGTVEKLDEEVDKKLSGLGSFANIMGFGDNIRCEFKSTFEGQTSEGTMYTDGERFRLESTMEGPGIGVMTSNMINDGSYSYTWGSSLNGSMAIKVANPEDEVGIDNDFGHIDDSEESYFDFDQQMEYDCDRWGVDDSVFIPPSGIEFMDMEAMMQEAMQGLPEGFEMPEGMPAY